MELVTSGPVAAPHMPMVSTTAPLAPDTCATGTALLDVLLPAALHSLLPLHILTAAARPRSQTPPSLRRLYLYNCPFRQRIQT